MAVLGDMLELGERGAELHAGLAEPLARAGVACLFSCGPLMAALQAALEDKQFAAAYIDAFETEPLPKDHPLWSTPNCYVIPHTGGGHANEYERHVAQFLENLRRFQKNEPLIDRIM